jgi:hypothetical protein
MHSEYIPSDFLDFEQFFKEVSNALNIRDISPELLKFREHQLHIDNEDFDTFYLNHMNDDNIKKFEAILNGSLDHDKIIFEVAECSLKKNKVIIKNKTLQFLKFENEEYVFEDISCAFIRVSSVQKQQKWKKSELRVIADIAKIQNFIRNNLCSSKVSSSILEKVKKYHIPSELWLDSHLWNILMRTLLRAGIPSRLLSSEKNFGDKLSISRSLIPVSDNYPHLWGIILFKKDEVIALCESIKDHSTTDNNKEMFFQLTPWIQVMSHFSLKYAEKISTEKIDSLKTEIETYIRENKLDIPDCDIAYLAKFIRHPDQRKGKRHYDRKKTKTQMDQKNRLF